MEGADQAARRLQAVERRTAVRGGRGHMVCCAVFLGGWDGTRHGAGGGFCPGAWCAVVYHGGLGMAGGLRGASANMQGAKGVVSRRSGAGCSAGWDVPGVELMQARR